MIAETKGGGVSDDVVVHAQLVWPGGTPERTRELAERLFHIPGGIVVAEGVGEEGRFVLFQMTRSEQMANAVMGLLQRRGSRLGVDVVRVDGPSAPPASGAPYLVVHVDPARTARGAARVEVAEPARLAKVAAETRPARRRSG